MTQVDWTTLQHVAEFIGFILASLVTAFYQARRNDKQTDKNDRDQDDAIKQEIQSSFSVLIGNYKERIGELVSELDAVKKSHEEERGVMVKAIYALVASGAVINAEDEYALRQIGIDLSIHHSKTAQHIDKAKRAADSAQSELDAAESETVPHDSG